VILFLVLLAFLGWRVWVRRQKRALVAGLDKPALWREPAPGRLNAGRKGEGLR
jgi:hypothetical protein